MTIEEIFGKISQHMIKGLMFHTQLSDYFNFLGLKGYSKCQEFHYYEENKAYKKLVNYYIEHYNKLIADMPVQDPKVIPDSWFKYSRQQVDTSTRKSSIQAAFDKWISWEMEVKNLYQNLYREAINLNEISAAKEIECLLLDVTEELKNAQQKQIELKIVDSDMVFVQEEQEAIYKKYIEKIKEI